MMILIVFLLENCPKFAYFGLFQWILWAVFLKNSFSLVLSFYSMNFQSVLERERVFIKRKYY